MIGGPIMRSIDPTVDVTPRADLIEHTLDDECACGPTSEAVKRGDGSVGWVRVHHSLDGREHTEDPAGS